MNEQTSEEAVILWADRHGLQGTITDLKCAFEDAATLYWSKRCEEMEKALKTSEKAINNTLEHLHPYKTPEVTLDRLVNALREIQNAMKSSL